MTDEAKRPVLVVVTQYAFVLFALANAWLLVEVSSSWLANRDEQTLLGRLIILNITLFVLSVVLIGNRSKYARVLTIASCILMSFRAVRRLYIYHQEQADDHFVMFVELVYIFETFLLLNIMLFLVIAGYFAFSPKVIRYFNPDRELKFSDPPPPPSFDA